MKKMKETMPLTEVSPIVVNKHVVKIFRFFKDKENVNEGYTASYEAVDTLFPNRIESYRKKFSIVAQRTLYIAKDELKHCIQVCTLPSLYYNFLSSQNNLNSNCITMQLLKEGEVEAFCSFMLCKKYTLVTAVGTSCDCCVENVLHCLYSIIDDIVLSKDKKLKPIITLCIENNKYNSMSNEAVKTTLQQKRCSILNSHNSSICFFEEQKILLNRLSSIVPKNSEIITFISYIPSYLCSKDSVFMNMFFGMSVDKVILYCLKVVLGENSRVDFKSRICLYTSEELSLSWWHWIKRNDQKVTTKKLLDDGEKDILIHNEKRCIEELICLESDFGNCKVSSFEKNHFFESDKYSNDTYKALSVILFGTGNRVDLIRQFFSSFWLVLSLVPYCINDYCTNKEYIVSTVERVLKHLKYKGTALVDENELKLLCNEFMNKKSSTVKLLRMVSEVYMDLTFPACTDDVSFLLKEYNLLPLFLYTEIKEICNEKNLNNQNILCKMCVLNYKIFEKSIINEKDLPSSILIIPIALCDSSNHYMTKLYSVTCSKSTYYENQH
jgi:hypothetical protein